jgi:hypothetical protein
MKVIRESERISLSECKRILSKRGKGFSDSEILAIRDWLYFIGEITLTVTVNKNNSL